MKQDKELFLRLFAGEVLKNVSVQTHTDWEKYLNVVLKKWVKKIEKLTYKL